MIHEDEKNNYVMGVDPYGYDGNTAAIVVMKKTKLGYKVVYSFQGRPPIDFEAEIKKLQEFYKVSDNHIFKQL